MKTSRHGAGEMAQQFRALDALAEDLSSDPNTYVRWLTNTDNSSLKGSSPLFWPFWVPAHTYVYILTQTHTLLLLLFKPDMVLQACSPNVGEADTGG